MGYTNQINQIIKLFSFLLAQSVNNSLCFNYASQPAIVGFKLEISLEFKKIFKNLFQIKQTLRVILRKKKVSENLDYFILFFLNENENTSVHQIPI